MEENKIILSTDRYEELVNVEIRLEMLKQVLFDKNYTRLNYDKSGLYFNPNSEALKLLFPDRYNAILKQLFEELEAENDE